MRQLRLARLCFLAVMGICACDPYRVVVDEVNRQMVCRSWPMEGREAVDILFVIDNSSSMLPNQANLIRTFPRLVEALRLSRLGDDLPDVRVGVISTDLGARGIPGDCRPYPGDDGRLRRLAGGGTVGSTQPWLAYNKGTTNVTGPPNLGAVQRFKRGFADLANLGSMGCSYEQPLEAARRALDPARKVNPGFLRPDALLAVIFISNEDDCSINNPHTFNFKAAPGFDSIHRCFQLGVSCKCPPAKACGGGAAKACASCTLRSSGSPLAPVSGYIEFFRTLKRTPYGTPDPGRVIMAALAGSTNAVSRCVGAKGKLELSSSCTGSMGLAYPAFRLRAVVSAFAESDPVQTLSGGAPYAAAAPAGAAPGAFADICKDDFSATMEGIGRRIAASLGPPCLEQPALTSSGDLACASGEVVGTTLAGIPVSCRQDSLLEAELYVDESTASGRRTIPRCHPALFDPRKGADHCGPEYRCPCWRMVPSPRCGASPGAPPHAVEVLRRGPAPIDVSGARLCHSAAGHAWGSAAVATLAR